MRLNIALNDEISLILNNLSKELKMSKTQVIANALLQMHEKAYIEKRKQMWLQGLREAKEDMDYQKEQRELAELGVDDGIE